MSDIPGLVEIAIRLVNSVFNLPDKLILLVKKLLGQVEMMSGLVNASFMASCKNDFLGTLILLLFSL